MFQRFCDVTSSAAYSSPYDESKGIDARNIIGMGGGEKPRCFLHALSYHVENFFSSYQDLTSWLHPISSISMPVFCPSRVRFRGSLNRNARKKYISCANLRTISTSDLYTRPPCKKTRCIFSSVERFISSTYSTYSTLRKSVNHHPLAWKPLVERETRLTVAEEPSRVCGGNEGVDISARAP